MRRLAWVLAVIGFGFAALVIGGYFATHPAPASSSAPARP